MYETADVRQPGAHLPLKTDLHSGKAPLYGFAHRGPNESRYARESPLAQSKKS